MRVTDLDKAIGMSTDDGQVARLRIGVALGNVLLYGEIQDLFLGVGSSPGILTDVLTFDFVLLDDEGGGHCGDIPTMD